MLLRRKQPVKLSEELDLHIFPNGLQVKVNPKLLSVGVLQENAWCWHCMEADITISFNAEGLILYHMVPAVQTARHFATECKNLNMKRISVIKKILNIAYFQQVSAPT